MNMLVGLNVILFPINRNVIKGVNIGEISVEIAVKDTDNATSPFERKVITSEAVPPGTVPTRISPIVNAVSSENMLANIKANRGIIIYCVEIPISMSLGLLNTLTKLSMFNVVPIPKRIIPSSMFNILKPFILSNTQLNALGLNRVKMTVKIISTI